MKKIQCAEIWGGVKNQDVDVCTHGMTVSLFSSSCAGGKGGDVYYFAVCEYDKLTRLALADVVGHGEAVSQVGEWVYEELAKRMHDLDQPGMLADLNTLANDQGRGAMTTAVVMAYYIGNRHVYYSYAGHPPMLARAGSNQWVIMSLPPNQTISNMPLGIMEKTRYDMGEIAFSKGDRLFLYSDGVIEAPNSHGELFTQNRLLEALAEASEATPMNIKAHVLARLREWTGGRLDHDDITLIAIQLE